MGLIQAAVGAAGGVMADQWKEYFYCPSMGSDVLVKKGENQKGKRNANTKGSDNIISNGSVVAVNEGQCMIIVEQGAIVEICSQPGQFVYDSSTEPSIFTGGLGQGIKASFQTFARRFSFGGGTGKDQRVYFFNTKEILGNKYGTANPIPFRVVDVNSGLDIDISIRCHGEYAYRMVDPILFYKNICSNVVNEFTREDIDSQLKSELLTAMQPALAKISAMGVRYSALPGHAQQIGDALNEVLSEKWEKRYGIKISTFGISSVTASKEDEALIKEMQKSAAFRDPRMAAAQLVNAQAAAMQAAASNTSAGPAMAFTGMNMAANAGGINAQNLFAMGQQQAPQQPYQQTPQMQPQSQAASGWTCGCGASGNPGKFCMNCGQPKPQESGFWTCSCGARNKGKFCQECGKPKPAGTPQYKCDKCGWEPKDPTHPPKFCPECGDPFDDGDLV